MTNAAPAIPFSLSNTRTTLPTFPFVYEEGNMASLHFEIDSVQSIMDKSLPDQLIFSYTKMMMGFLLFNDRPEHIGMIGLGGGSLPKYCYRHLPRTRISIAEISSEVIALRTYFQIPKDNDRFKVLLEDGAEFVRRQPDAFDVLMVDGFDIKGQPPQLCSQTFYEDCYRALTSNGILVVNLCDWGYKLALWKMRQVFEEIFLCDCPMGQNRIAFAMKSDISNRSSQQLMRRSDGLSLLHPIDLGSVALQFISSIHSKVCAESKSSLLILLLVGTPPRGLRER
jgi:spermidine synthase